MKWKMKEKYKERILNAAICVVILILAGLLLIAEGQ